MLKLILSGIAAFLLAIFPHDSAIYSATSNNYPIVENDDPDPDLLSSFDEEHRDELAALIEHFEGKGLQFSELLEDSRFEINETIGDKFRHSAEKKSVGIEEYKKILGFNAKRDKIVEFVNEHSDQLQKAEERYGISRYVISAILGVESDFGSNVGSHNPFNTYVSMYATGYRADFAKAQLEELLIFAKDRELDIYEMKSSYAGAMSFAQFIPYSLNKWFVGDDLYDMDDNILSVGNYLSYFKERTGSTEKAVFRYNPSKLYTQAVLDLASEAEAIALTAR